MSSKPTGSGVAAAPPMGWTRLAIAVGAVGFGAAALGGTLLYGRFEVRERLPEVLLVAVCAVAWWVAPRHPRAAVAATLTAAVAELLGAIATQGLNAAALYAFPLVTVASGMLLGGRGALATAAASCAGIPLAFALSPDAARAFVGHQGFHVLSAEIVIAGTAAITLAGVRAHAAVLAASERSRRRYVDLFENAPDGLLSVDAEGRIVDANPAAGRLFGARPGELAGRELEAVLGHAVPADLSESRPGSPAQLERAGTDGPLVLEITARAQRGGDGPGGSLLVIREVTERRKLEERLRHAQRLESVGRLAGGLAHDFNNLLTAVGGNASVLAGHPDPEVRELAAEIAEAQQRGTALTRQLLAFARRDVRRAQTIDLAEAVAGVQRLLARLLGEQHPLDLEVTPPAPVHTDRAQLEQALLNLVANARDAMPGGGPVSVRVRAVDEAEASGLGSSLGGPQALLEVTGRGIGMTAETRAKIFEPFFTTKARGQGTGLGLATVHGVVAQSGGHVAVETAPGRGATFRIFLPRATGDTSGPLLTPVPDAAPPPDGGTERVLLVEDDPRVRSLAWRVLTRAGYDVAQAGNVDEALATAVPAGGFDLVVTDVVMPGRSGLELAELLRAAIPGLQVVFMSGYFEPGAAPRGAPDPRELLQKPFTPDELLRRVRRALDRRSGPGAYPGAPPPGTLQ